MSFVALLAGERHTDRPSTACPVITAFVIKINDAIDCDTRQALKPLAHDILGTNDGHSRERAWFLARTCINDVFARLVSETGVASKLPALPVSRDESIDFNALSSELNAIGKRSGVDSSLLFDIRYLLRALARGSDELVAIASAVLFVDTAHRNGAPPVENPFWQAAIAMFSHLCGIGKVSRGPVAIDRGTDHHGGDSRAVRKFICAAVRLDAPPAMEIADFRVVNALSTFTTISGQLACPVESG